MKKRGIRMLAVISVISVIAACGGEDGTEKDPSETLEENLQNGSEYEQTAESGAEALLQYRDQLRFCDLSGTQLIYEEMETEGYSYFMTKGLKGLPEKKEGCLDAVILDFDQDGMEELLTFDLQEGSEAYQIQAKIYEYQDGQVVESAVWEFLNYAIADQCDGGDIRFMIKDGKYICMDSRQQTFISADGASIDLSVCYYDGAEMVKAAEFYGMGSDWSDVGKEETELIEQLRSMGFDKTADAIYDRDDFHLYAADEGVEPLFKISLINSSATGETDWDEMPTAVIRQINAGPVEEEFILPESNSRILEADELSGMTKAELRIARNEIYARYGWWFESEDLADHFEGKAWYVGGAYIDDVALSDVERANIDLILEMEETAPTRVDVMLESDMDIEGGTALTAMELGEISGFLRTIDAYGFLQSFYEDVRDVNVGEVLYGGAGILDGEFSDSVRTSYLEAVGKSEFDTDFIALRESDIDALLKRRTGYGLSDMRTRLSWTYLKKEHAYCMEAGDTNYMEAAVVDGMKTDDGMYYILYENPMLEYTDEETTCMVTLKKQGDEYQFVANVRQ
ncbi:MAG: YARHG domain-containing protein [Roseburia sp.]|nr:YARHG domain-containing protein [Roseburia sp.]